jgi:hypothetical protein
MKRQVLAVFTALLLGWLATTCQNPPPTPTPIPSPTSTATLPPTLEPAATFTPPPTPLPPPLSDDQALDLLLEEVSSRGVDPDTIRLRIGGRPRRASVRYTSTYQPDRSEFRAQMTLITLAAASTVVRVDPPIEGGLDVSVLPVEGEAIGLLVIAVDRSSLDAWANGILSDQEFVAAWQLGAVTVE